MVLKDIPDGAYNFYHIWFWIHGQGFVLSQALIVLTVLCGDVKIEINQICVTVESRQAPETLKFLQFTYILRVFGI